VLVVCTHLINVIIDVQHAIFSNTRHSVSLPTACLPIGKYACCEEQTHVLAHSSSEIEVTEHGCFISPVHTVNSTDN
jgi:hypothetical protein